jgi:glycerophosphoryl diester phosphodiesterase
LTKNPPYEQRDGGFLLIPLDIMKTGISILFSVLISGPVLSQSVNRFQDSQAIDALLQYQPGRQKPLILAHRGGPGLVDTENSIVTFTQTASALPDAIIEMDVRMTLDSGFVLLHDATLDRESNATGAVAEQTLVDLKNVKLKTLSGERTNQTITTFTEVLNWNKNRYLLALDVKPGTDPLRVMQEVEMHQAGHSVFIICYSFAEAQRVRDQYPTVWLAVGVNSMADLDRLETNSLASGHLIALTPQQLQPASYYERLHKLGVLCAVGTYGTGQLDEKPIKEVAIGYRDVFSRGGDVLTTDRPLEVSVLF